MEDCANIYPTNIHSSKMKVEENYKCSYCTDTVDVIEQFVFSNVQLSGIFGILLKGIILRECGIKVKLHLKDIMFGAQQSNVKETC